MEAELGAETGGETGVETEAKTGGETVAETGGERVAKTEDETGAETEAETVAETEAETGGETVAKTEAETGGETVAETEAETGAKTEAKTVAETGAKTGAETGGETVTETVAETGVETEAKTTGVEGIRPLKRKHSPNKFPRKRVCSFQEVKYDVDIMLREMCPEFLRNGCFDEECKELHDFIGLSKLPSSHVISLLHHLCDNKLWYARYCVILEIGESAFGSTSSATDLRDALFREVMYDFENNLLGNDFSIVEIMLSMTCSTESIHSSWLELASTLPEHYKYPSSITQIIVNKWPIKSNNEVFLAQCNLDKEHFVAENQSDVESIMHATSNEWLEVIARQVYKWCDPQSYEVLSAICKCIMKIPSLAIQRFVNFVHAAKTVEPRFFTKYGLKIRTALSSIGLSVICALTKQEIYHEALQMIYMMRDLTLDPRKYKEVLWTPGSCTAAYKMLMVSRTYLETLNYSPAIGILRDFNLLQTSTNDWKLYATEGDILVRDRLCETIMSTLLKVPNIVLAHGLFLNVLYTENELLVKFLGKFLSEILLQLIKSQLSFEAAEVFSHTSEAVDENVVRLLLVVLKTKNQATDRVFKQAVLQRYYLPVPSMVIPGNTYITIYSTYVVEEIEVIINALFVTLHKQYTQLNKDLPCVHIMIKFEPYTSSTLKNMPEYFSYHENNCSLVVRLVREVLTKMSRSKNVPFLTNTFFSPSRITLHAEPLKNYLQLLPSL